MITGSSDQISTKGVYTTTLELFRIKNIDGTVPQPAKESEKTVTHYTSLYESEQVPKSEVNNSSYQRPIGDDVPSIFDDVHLSLRK